MTIVPKKAAKTSRKKRPRRGRAAAPQSGLGATRERGRQFGGVILEYAPDDENRGRRVERHRAVYECKLDAYLAHKKIDASQFKAGMRYREAWQFKAHGIRTVDSTSFDRIDNATILSPEERENRKNWAERTLHQAEKEAELTISQSMMIRRVCGEDESIGYAGHMKTLARALDKLAVFWGFKPSEKSP